MGIPTTGYAVAWVVAALVCHRATSDEEVSGLLEGGLAGAARDVVAASASVKEKSAADKSATTAAAPQKFPELDARQIARASVTPIARAFNGSWSAVKAAGSGAAMMDEYAKAALKQVVDKEFARVKGNKATIDFSKDNNARIKAMQDRQYHMRQTVTAEGLKATREAWNNQAAEIRMAHAISCQNLTRHNPYPKNSTQYKAVSAACSEERSSNAQKSTAIPPGSHDNVHGPYASGTTVVSTEAVAKVTSALSTGSGSGRRETQTTTYYSDLDVVELT